MSTLTVNAAIVSAGRPMVRVATVTRGGTRSARLTRRGRLVLSATVIVLLVLAAVLMSGGVAAVAGSAGDGPVATERVTVRPGETLWASG